MGRRIAVLAEAGVLNAHVIAAYARVPEPRSTRNTVGRAPPSTQRSRSDAWALCNHFGGAQAAHGAWSSLEVVVAGAGEGAKVGGRNRHQARSLQEFACEQPGRWRRSVAPPSP